MSNRYLENNFAPVREEVTAVDLPVTGQLPVDLDGRYLRIGPNPVGDPDPIRYHWFIGDGMVHGVRLADGQAQWYRNRYVRSQGVLAELGEPAREGGVGGSDFGANTNVLTKGGRTFALVEAGSRPYELTDELDTVGPSDFGGTLPYGYTAHPHEDPDTGEWHAVSYNWIWGNRVQYTVLDSEARVRSSVGVKVHGSPMIHDCAITEHFVVIYDLPVTFDKNMALSGMSKIARLPLSLGLSRVIGKNPLPDPVIARLARGPRTAPDETASLPYSWDPAYPARIGLLPRDGSSEDVRWFEIDPCYIFHTLNAFEDGDTVVLDVVRHERMFATDFTGPNEGASTLTRYTIDLTADKVREERFDERSQEFPRLDQRLTGKRHRYGYAVGFEDSILGDTVIRHDLAAGTSQVRRLGTGREASEFCFVPRAGSTAEDDGLLMGYVHDRAVGRSDLVVLDAQTLDDVAAVHLPVRVPSGFHGNWCATA